MNKSYLIILFMLIIALPITFSYCNETQTITYANRTSQTGDYNITIDKTCVDDTSAVAGIGIILFVLIVSLALGTLPFLKEDFVKNEITNLILRRACWIVSLFLMSLNSAIVATVAEAAQLDLVQEMFRYMWIFMWAGYLMCVLMVIGTLFNVVELWNKQLNEKRTGFKE